MIKNKFINKNYLWLSSISTLIALVVSVPLLYLLFRAVSHDGFIELIFRERIFWITLKSILLVISVTFFSIIISFFLAHFLTKSDVPFKKLLTILCCLPIVIPSYVYGMIFVHLLGPRGKVFQILNSWNLIDSFPDLYGFWGATITLTFLSYPYVFLPLRAAMMSLDDSFEDASRSLGRGRIKTFYYITLPLLLPAMRSGGLLVALYTLSDFGAVALLRYQTFTWAIMNMYNGAYNRISAAALSLVLVFFAILILSMESFLKGAKNFFSSSSASSSSSLIQLDNKKWIIFFLILLAPIIGALIPIIGLLTWLIKGIIYEDVIVFNFSTIFTSLKVSFLAAISTMIISLPISFFAVKYRNKFSLLIEKISYIGFGLPSIVVGLSLVYFSINFLFPIYQTTAVLIFGYSVLFLPVGVSAIKSTLIQLNPNLEDASRGLGYSYWKTFIKVTIPLLMPSILAGSLLIFLLTMKELPLTLVLSPLNFKSLPTSIWAYAAEAFFAAAALPALILILLSGPASAYLVLKKNNIDVRG